MKNIVDVDVLVEEPVDVGEAVHAERGVVEGGGVPGPGAGLTLRGHSELHRLALHYAQHPGQLDTAVTVIAAYTRLLSNTASFVHKDDNIEVEVYDENVGVQESEEGEEVEIDQMYRMYGTVYY